MSEMIERVSRAIHDSDEQSNIVGPFDWTKRENRVRDMYRRRARAAIEAMRGQCSEAMLRAFWDGAPAPIPQTGGYPDDSRSSEWYGDADDFRKGFDAMIDAALK